MESHRDDTQLTAELRAMRPSPDPAFVAELDAHAAAGFPSRGAATFGRLTEKLSAAPRWRIPAFAAAAAMVAIAIATAVVAISEDGSTLTDPHRGQLAVDRLNRLPAPAGIKEHLLSLERGSSGVQYSNAPPVKGSATQNSNASAAVGTVTSGPYAARAARRDIERSARIVLGTDAGDVRSAAARVFETVHAYDGIVMRSSVRDGSGGEAGAVFDLLIPSGRLGDAMAAFSGIAEVRSRSEATRDVTAPTIGLEERLRDARATVDGLLARLASADSDAERAEVEAELRAERRHATALRSRLASLQRRTSFSRVSLRIETGAGAATADSDNNWGVDDALSEAGRILTIAAGVTLIGLAILAPLTLVCLLAWLARRRWVRRGREHALG